MVTGRFWGDSGEPLSAHPHLASGVKEVIHLAWVMKPTVLKEPFNSSRGGGPASHFKSLGARGAEAGSRTSSQMPSVPSARVQLCRPG